MRVLAMQNVSHCGHYLVSMARDYQTSNYVLHLRQQFVAHSAERHVSAKQISKTKTLTCKLKAHSSIVILTISFSRWLGWGSGNITKKSRNSANLQTTMRMERLLMAVRKPHQTTCVGR
jgi:hypothetical protein